MLSTSQNCEGMLAASMQNRDLLNDHRNNAAWNFDALSVMAKVQDEETQDSGGSGFSDLSALENETDEFGRLLLQHQRDAQRLNNARGGHQQAFRKARPRHRIAETFERQEREREEKEGKNHERVGSNGSNESDPPVTVPREWGRRARKQTGWLRKVAEPSENGEELAAEASKPDDDAIYPRRTVYTGDVDWRSNSEQPLQSIENEHTPPSMRRQRHTTTPSSMRHINTTMKPGTDIDDQDFTAASLLASTPASRLPRKIDELARREIETVERRAVATRALDEMDQRLPNATLRRTSSSRLRERAIADSLASTPPPPLPPVPAQAKSTSPSRIPRRPENGISNKENVPLNRGENGHHVKDGDADELTNRTAQAVNIKNMPKPGHGRNDSMNLLRKLARVSSMSPSPARHKGGVEEVERRRKSDPVVDAERRDGDERPVSNGVDAKAEAKSTTNDVDATPMPQEPSAEAKTPLVTGGWVDTTLNTEAQPEVETVDLAPKPKQESQSNGDASEDLRPTKREPKHPKSALAAIIDEAQDRDNDYIYGESTIQSLEDIVNPDLDPTDPTLHLDLDAMSNQELENLDDGRALTQAEKDRRQENLAMEAMNKHLRAARTSIKDANKGLRRVENRIETAQEEDQLASKARHKPTTRSGSTQNFESYTITAHGKPAWTALWNEFLSCFYTYSRNTNPDASKYTRLRLTWFGLLCLCWLTWYIFESTLCSFYCHPFYASWSNGVDPNAPRFPFVIPTLLFRPVKFIWQPAFEFLGWGGGAVFYAVFGDMFSEPDPPPVRPAAVKKVVAGMAGGFTETGARVVRSVVEAAGEVGSMWDDEVL